MKLFSKNFFICVTIILKTLVRNKDNAAIFSEPRQVKVHQRSMLIAYNTSNSHNQSPYMDSFHVILGGISLVCLG